MSAGRGKALCFKRDTLLLRDLPCGAHVPTGLVEPLGNPFCPPAPQLCLVLDAQLESSSPVIPSVTCPETAPPPPNLHCPGPVTLATNLEESVADEDQMHEDPPVMLEPTDPMLVDASETESREQRRPGEGALCPTALV
jgi:hypothetical protein